MSDTKKKGDGTKLFSKITQVQQERHDWALNRLYELRTKYAPRGYRDDQLLMFLLVTETSMLNNVPPEPGEEHDLQR